MRYRALHIIQTSSTLSTTARAILSPLLVHSLGHLVEANALVDRHVPGRLLQRSRYARACVDDPALEG